MVQWSVPVASSGAWPEIENRIATACTVSGRSRTLMRMRIQYVPLPRTNAVSENLTLKCLPRLAPEKRDPGWARLSGDPEGWMTWP
jgi:hypothetical protein